MGLLALLSDHTYCIRRFFSSRFHSFSLLPIYLPPCNSLPAFLSLPPYFASLQILPFLSKSFPFFIFRSNFPSLSFRRALPSLTTSVLLIAFIIVMASSLRFCSTLPLFNPVSYSYKIFIFVHCLTFLVFSKSITSLKK